MRVPSGWARMLYVTALQKRADSVSIPLSNPEIVSPILPLMRERACASHLVAAVPRARLTARCVQK